MSKRQRATAIEEHERKLREKNEAQYREAIKVTPAMPVLNQCNEEHRERLNGLYEKKLLQIVDEMYALVAKVLSPKEIAANPGAQAAMDKEWKKLVKAVGLKRRSGISSRLPPKPRRTTKRFASETFLRLVL